MHRMIANLHKYQRIVWANNWNSVLKIYTSTKKIPGLENAPLTERLAALEDAGKRLSVPEKTVLNVLKLLVLVPVFVLILRTSEDFMSLVYAAIILMLYPILVKPIQYSLSVKHLKLHSNQQED